MNSPSITCAALPEKILAVMRDPPVREELNYLIALCHSIAIVHLRRKITLATLQRRFHYTGFSDLAYDCIAELFRRDEHGSLVRLKAFFRGAVQQQASDQDLLVQIKRLVCSRVNQSIFTMYFEADPSLGKTLRNIRLALQTMQHACLIERCGESCFVPKACSTLEHLPQVSLEELQISLRRLANGSERVPEVLARFSLYLRKQSDHSRIIPLVTLALAVRSLYSSLPADTIVMGETETLRNADTLTIVKCACSHVKRMTREKYVVRKKVNSCWFDLYLQCAVENVSARLEGRNGMDASLYHHLACFLPGMDREEYVKMHRSTVEYLTHLMWKRTGELLKESA